MEFASIAQSGYLDLHRHEHQNRRNITHHFTLRVVQSIHPVASHRHSQAVLLRWSDLYSQPTANSSPKSIHQFPPSVCP